jgi:putative transposase
MSVFVSLLMTLRGCVRSRAALHLEVLAVRHQLQVIELSRPQRLRLTRADRVLWAWASCAWNGWRAPLVIVKPQTVIAWHRQGFRLFWTWKSRRRTGRPTVPADVRTLIRTMSEANPLWGAPRIHGELLKLGMEIGQASVAKYMIHRRQPPSQTWRTFLANHIGQITAADFFVVPTATCRVLFVLVILAHERRRIVHVAVTEHPTAAWTAQQLHEPFPWDDAPRYLVRDRDHAFSAWAMTASAMDIHEVLTAARSPWQNAYAERLIGSIRRECLDHVIVGSPRGLRRVLHAYLEYYLKSRTHLSLHKDAPVSRPVSPPADGNVVASRAPRSLRTDSGTLSSLLENSSENTRRPSF